MAIYYDIIKVKALRKQKPEHITTLLNSLSVYIRNIKVLVKDKDHKAAEAVIDNIILITDRLGIDFAHDEALQVKKWSELKGKKKEIDITLKAMVSHTKNAIREIRKDFLS